VFAAPRRRVGSPQGRALAMGRKSRSAFAVGVFALSALVTYNVAAMAHGHSTASTLGHHMDSHISHLDDKHDAFSFEPHVVARAGGGRSGHPRHAVKGARVGLEGHGHAGVSTHRHRRDDRVEVAGGVEGAEKNVPKVENVQDAAADADATLPASALLLRREKARGTFHVLLTANDAPYQRWQSRVMYYQYEKLRREHPNSALGGFTRILHSGHPDGLMDEIPTKIVNTLPPTVRDDGYVVLHRPYAFKQWLERFANDLEEEYVLMSEPDHLFVAPPPLLATRDKAVAFPFFYIAPNDPKFAPIVERFNEVRAPKEAFKPIGSSPVMIHLDALKRVVPKWHELAVAMKRDKEADAAFGWVVEMWAYSIASAQVGVVHETIKHFMLQPPYDKSMNVDGKEAYIVHYTYGDDYDKNGRFTPGVNQGADDLKNEGGWHFDKRDFTNRAPRKGELTLPPANAGEAIRRTIEIILEAMDALPNWGL
jgi:hypothetical protein